ncbi:hypothetical protein CCR75_000141 [Bremia lactucae]|uniref:DNA polymerase n=1 Tax=Bremia lactucae TaxID=4779 RepID=A0A976FLT5_BRELC|nr:hypothetical protein CCR75_000141 [Bremia lactucae]
MQTRGLGQRVSVHALTLSRVATTEGMIPRLSMDAEELRVEAVVVDYYMRSPLPTGSIEYLPDSPCYQHAHEVPIVRVFGATPAGQKALVHVHGIFPYFYFNAENDPDFEDPERLRKLLPQLAKDIETANALNQQQRQQTDKYATDSSKSSKIIAKMLIVQGTPFYGYHLRSKLFVQIFLYNPRAVPYVVRLLESGSIGDRHFQPYESHIPFLLQVFADYSIEGMNHVAFSNVKFRFPLPVSQEHLMEATNTGIFRIFLLSTTPTEKINGIEKSETSFKGRHAPILERPKQWFDRTCCCALEVDVAAACILNPKQFQLQHKKAEGVGDLRHVPSLAAIWEEERLRRIQNGERGTPELSLSLLRNSDISNESSTSPSPAKSASSLLSQSFFKKKIKDSVDMVMARLEEQQQHNEIDCCDQHGPQFAGDVMSCGNSIAAESKFSYSQAENEGGIACENDQKEDREIVTLLLDMQQMSESDQKKAECRQDDEHVNYDTPNDSEHDSEGIDNLNEQHAEIGDILASQQLIVKYNTSPAVDQSTSVSWWDVAERISRAKTSPVSELGSPRVVVRASTGRQIKARSSKFGSNIEDIPLVEDMKDLLPPRPQKSVSLTPLKEEDRPVDFVASSLTPHPQPHGASQRMQPPEAAESNSRLWMFSPDPPTYLQILSSSRDLGITPMKYQPVCYSNAAEIPEKAMVFGGKKYDFTPQNIKNLPEFDTAFARQLLYRHRSGEGSLKLDNARWCKLSRIKKPSIVRGSGEKMRCLRMPARMPPDASTVEAWVSIDAEAFQKTTESRRKRAYSSLVPTASLSSTLSSLTIASNITILSIEVFAGSRASLLPNPLYDPVQVICYAVDAQEGPSDTKTKDYGILMVKLDGMEEAAPESVILGVGSKNSSVSFASDERELFCLLEEVVNRWDPDFLAGFEVQKASIGYLVDRASKINVNLIQSLSRLPSAPMDLRNRTTVLGREGDSQKEASIGTTWGVNKAAGLWIHGRYIINLWRMTRSELKLSRYALEDVVWAVLKRKYPVYSAEQLTSWFQIGGSMRWKVLKYIMDRAKLNIQIIYKMQLITRTSEMARLFGIDFYSVLSRGSQYRVEAVMLRVTKRKNYLLISPSKTQVAGQAPMECIPLVMEPHSSFYSDPVVVLDFRSLYPSLVIGYNMCYSTILGRLKDGQDSELETSLGVVDFSPSAVGLLQCKNDVIVAPNGTLFCPKSYRHGVLPLILDEILSTRIMVKKAMKSAKNSKQKRLEKVLYARQLALKLISNVTYGYTAAGFSGRMPCAQLADAIVQTGRCTLEATVRLIEERSEWNAKVVYGDTDSVFVLLTGRSKTDAFQIGQEIANAVTASNPRPVTLKLEKVYMGCFLVSKKRYVGNKFENPTQKVGTIESKGIETVRRDSCGVVKHALKTSLSTLFESCDLSKVKEKLERFWIQIIENRVPLKEFIFAKEVRLGTYSNGSAPPAALVSIKAMGKDSRAEPRYAERVPYVVVNGSPGARLMDLVVSPDEYFSKRKRYSINYHYYINKQIIPSLERLFLLTGANIRSWYATLPRTSVKARQYAFDNPSPTSTIGCGFRSIDSFYLSKHCRLCGSIGINALCQNCSANPQRSLLAIHTAFARHEKAVMALKVACTACADRDAFGNCNNYTCPVWNHIKLFEVDKTTLTYQDR